MCVNGKNTFCNWSPNSGDVINNKIKNSINGSNSFGNINSIDSSGTAAARATSNPDNKNMREERVRVGGGGGEWKGKGKGICSGGGRGMEGVERIKRLKRKAKTWK